MPALCVVDVKLMSEGKLQLADHPLVKAEELPLLFYYTDKTEPLLFSTYDLFNFGTIKKSKNYEGAFKTILKRINHLMILERENLTLKIEQKSHLEKIEILQDENKEIKKEDRFKKLAHEMILELESHRGQLEFQVEVEQLFDSIDEVLEFASMELSFNGQKLISPLSHNRKSKTIPSLWLGQVCPDGIEVFAQNMATQVAMDVMGGQLVSLLIKGQKTKPDKIIFVKSKSELFYNSFDWNLIESFLSGLNASYELKLNRKPIVENNFSNTFLAMSFLDQYVFGKSIYDHFGDKKTIDYRLINLDLSSLVEAISKKGNNRFYWNKFHQEFINKLEIQTRCSFKEFAYGVHSLSFLVEAQDFNYFFEELKIFANKFFYWKYFENSESVLGLEIKPKVAMLPLSSFAYLKSTYLTESTQKPLSKSEAQKRTKEIIWGRDSINEI
jgi:hypothetical protein